MIYIIFISNDMEPAVKLKKNILSYKQTNTDPYKHVSFNLFIYSNINIIFKIFITHKLLLCIIFYIKRHGACCEIEKKKTHLN